MTKITVEHSTQLDFGALVLPPSYTFRLHPRTSCEHRLISYQLDVTPAPAGSAGWIDQDGNLVRSVWFDAPLFQIELRVRFSVQVLTADGTGVLPIQPPPTWPLTYREPVAAALAQYRAQEHIGPAVRPFAAGLISDGAMEPLAFLTALNHEIFRSCRHTAPHSGPPWLSDLTLRLREGAAGDLAMLFCDACRVMGIAARFVSGYDCTLPHRAGDTKRAWAEAYVPDAGWRGYDPSRGVTVDSNYIAVAAAAEPELAVSVDGLSLGDPPAVRQERIRIRVHA